MKNIRDIEISKSILGLLELEGYPSDLDPREDIHIIKENLTDYLLDFLNYKNYRGEDFILSTFLEGKLWDIGGTNDVYNYITNVEDIPSYKLLATNILDNILAELEPIATYGISNNSGVLIHDIEGDTLIASFNNDTIKGYEIDYNTEGEPFFLMGEWDIPLNECIRTNY